MNYISPKSKDNTGTVIRIASGALLTLALNTGTGFSTHTSTRGGSLISTTVQAAVTSLTPGDGPFALYIKSNDLSSAEFEAYLELNGPVSPDDTTADEVSTRGRKARYIGLIVPFGNGGVAALDVKNMAMSGLRFTESGEGGGLNYFLYNLGRDLTTGSSFNLTAQDFVRWNRSG